MRNMLFVSLTVSALFTLSACQASDAGEERTDDSHTKQYKAANGEVEIPENPKRIVVAVNNLVGYFEPLDITPIGTPKEVMENPDFQEILAEVTSIGTVDNPSLETIVELDPDLIITLTRYENIEQFEAIAPTVAIEYGEMDYREQLRAFGEMTNKQAEAEEWITNWNEQIELHKEAVHEAVGEQTVSILQPHANGIYAFGHNYARGGEIIYDEFQLKAPEIAQAELIDNRAGFAEISIEVLPDYAGDFLFTAPWTGDDLETSNVYETSIWKNLDAVKKDNVYMFENKFSNYNDPVALESQLSFIVDALTKQ
ncbi:ferrichrome-binding periplasmic protein precursor [Bacillus sp. JCM 19046]|nr:ferrichrome-binding periplasmic protein precursor [Bacillus sp. JCM 19045]GAF20329.1 ferrichrome-binding periplasmic protein precursor [Bacillus sp. JCM 19046]